MILIWKSRLKKFGLSKRQLDRRPFRTARLYNLMDKAAPKIANGATDLRFSFSHREYGIYVERGTGRGVFKGNHGDIGRENLRRKRRQRRHRDARPWKTRPLNRSILNLRDFLAESLGIEFVEIVESVSIDHGNRRAMSPRSGRASNNLSVPGLNIPL